jgi:GNAT superfamily N-acetyltransferase
MDTKIAGYQIRKAEREDVPVILAFIRRLAEYEKLAHEVVATEAKLAQYLFGDKRVAEVLLGIFEGIPVGFALYFYNFSTFLARPGIYLEDLYVLEEHRSRGFGRTLLECLAHLAVEQECGRLEWAVLDWNEPAIEFYKLLGARMMDEWIVNRVSGEALERLAARWQ